jgi:Transcriptional regulator, AbiEi antitoxin
VEPATAPAHLNTVELDWYLPRQSGVISCAQARATGLSQDAVDRRVASGRWERLHPGVYLAADHPHTDEVRMRAAVLWAGKDAVAYPPPGGTTCADRAASHAERLLVRLLRAARITGWKLNYQVQGYLIDLAFPAQQVAIEVDGWA